MKRKNPRGALVGFAASSSLATDSRSGAANLTRKPRTLPSFFLTLFCDNMIQCESGGALPKIESVRSRQPADADKNKVTGFVFRRGPGA